MILTRLDFRNRFTATEKVRIYQAAESAIELRVWLDDLAVSEEVDTEYPQTIGAIQALEAAGLLDPGRTAADVLGVVVAAGQMEQTVTLAKGTPVPDTDLVTLSAGTYLADDLVECARAADPDTSICAYPARLIAPGSFQ